MNKSELVKAIAKKAEVTNAAAQAVLEAFVEAVKGSLKKGDKVQLIGFGSFSTVKREARKGVNPQTKKPIKIAAKKVAKFIPGKVLLTLPFKKVYEYRRQIGAELGQIIYTMFNSKFPELDDLRPKTGDSHDIGLTHGDMCSIILVNPKTMKITGIIDWEYSVGNIWKQNL